MQKIIIIGTLLILFNIIIALLIILIPAPDKKLNQNQNQAQSPTSTIEEITELIPNSTTTLNIE